MMTWNTCDRLLPGGERVWKTFFRHGNPFQGCWNAFEGRWKGRKVAWNAFQGAPPKERVRRLGERQRHQLLDVYRK